MVGMKSGNGGCEAHEARRGGGVWREMSCGRGKERDGGAAWQLQLLERGKLLG
jgi:hypothetical protein